MGADAPAQKDAQGSGLTFQRSMLPTDIQKSSQDAFRTGLNSTINQTYNLDQNIPSYQRVGQFTPGALNLQNNVNLQSRSDPYNLASGSLDPLVQAQLSKAQSDRAGILSAQNNQLASRLGPGNQALLTGLTNQNNLNAQLAAGPEQLAALQQQRDFNTQNAQLDLQRMNAFNDAQLQGGQFANQAALQGRQAAENAFNVNSSATQANNQIANQGFTNQLQSAQAAQGLLQNLGQGLISTSPQIQSQLTIADLEKIRSNPNLIASAIADVPTGILGNDGLSQLGIDPAWVNQINTYQKQISDLQNQLKNQGNYYTQQQKGRRY